MSDRPPIRQLTGVLSAPLGDLIAAVGRGVADAQQALDRQTHETFRAIYGSDEAAYAEFRALGYRPTFYVLPETTAEILVSLTIDGSAAVQAPGAPSASGVRVNAAPLDAGYRGRYDFELNAASRLTFKIVPVPPSPQAEAMRVVPPLMNQMLAEAQRRLALIGVNSTVRKDQGDGAVKEDEVVRAKVMAVEPPAGTILAPGQPVTLTVHVNGSPDATTSTAAAAPSGPAPSGESG